MTTPPAIKVRKEHQFDNLRLCQYLDEAVSLFKELPPGPAQKDFEIK